MRKYEQHPLSACYRPLTPTEYAALKEGIRTLGQLVPAVLFEGKVLDGWHRYKACEELGIEVKTETPQIDDPLAYVRNYNVTRRHDTPSQISIAVGKMAKLVVGSNQYEKKVPTSPRGSLDNSTVAELAAKHGIGFSTAQRGAKIVRHGHRDVVGAVERGELAAPAAAQIVDLSQEDQPAALAKALSAKTEKPAKKRSGGRRGSKKRETKFQRQLRLQELLRNGKDPGETVGLSRQEVDPDFKGSSMEWMDKYGHVQIMTKGELEADRRQAALMDWISALNDLHAPFLKYLQVGPFALEELEAWIGRSPERRLKKLNEMVSLITRTKDSIEWLLPVLSKLGSAHGVH